MTLLATWTGFVAGKAISYFLSRQVQRLERSEKLPMPAMLIRSASRPAMLFVLAGGQVI